MAIFSLVIAIKATPCPHHGLPISCNHIHLSTVCTTSMFKISLSSFVKSKNNYEKCNLISFLFVSCLFSLITHLEHTLPLGGWFKNAYSTYNSSLAPAKNLVSLVCPPVTQS